MSKRVDKLLISDIVNAIDEINEFIEGLDFDSFSQDAKTKAAVVRNLEVIGEAASMVSEVTLYQYPLIEWKQMKSLRNKLIHQYFGVDYSIVWHVINDEIQYNYPFLKNIDFNF